MGWFDKYDAELMRLRQLVARKREHFPDWTLEQVVTAAVDELNDPQLEADPGYRHYLESLSLARPPDVRGEDS